MKQKNIRVLLVEDDQMLAGVYATKLEQLGYTYKHVADGESGIKEAAKFNPDVVLLDVILPKRDGFAVLKALKTARKTKSVAVILLTNLGQDDDINKGMELGAASYLTKTNCTPTQIVSEIDKVLDKKKGSKKKKTVAKKQPKKASK